MNINYKLNLDYTDSYSESNDSFFQSQYQNNYYSSSSYRPNLYEYENNLNNNQYLKKINNIYNTKKEDIIRISYTNNTDNIIFNIDKENSSTKSGGSKLINEEAKKIIFKRKCCLKSHSTSNKEKNLEEKLSNKESKNNNGRNKHTKYSDDNLRRKCKCILFNQLLKFINKKLKETYKNLGHGKKMKKLMILKEEQTSNSKLDFNQKLMNKTLGDIFSCDISSRITHSYPENNKRLIEELINEKDIEKRKYFKKLFNLTFIDCLKHFISEKGENRIEELDGLELFKDFKNNPIELKKGELI